MPVKKPIRMKKQVRANTKKSTRTAWLTDGRALAGVVILCVVTAGMLMATHQSPSRSVIASVQPTAETQVARAEAAPAASSMASAGASAVEATAVESVPDPKSAPVTITGCLERSDETFRLKDTTGENAPKSRSWKSGFLKKASASIEVVDTPRRLNLPKHVGQRVSVTGTLVDREMHIRSLQRIAPSCSSQTKVKI